MRFKDDSRRFARLMVREIEGSVERTTAAIQGTASILVNREQPTRRSQRTGQRYGTDPSKPGEPPKQVTGTLKKGIISDVERTRDRVVGRVGFASGHPAAGYAAILELGLGKLRGAARPFLRPALDGGIPRYRRELARMRNSGRLG